MILIYGSWFFETETDAVCAAQYNAIVIRTIFKQTNANYNNYNFHLSFLFSKVPLFKN